MSEWDTSKPLQGNIPPRAALDTLALFESRLSRLQEETRQLTIAKEALELDSVHDDRLSPVASELTGLRDVWSNLFRVGAEFFLQQGSTGLLISPSFIFSCRYGKRCPRSKTHCGLQSTRER